MRRIIVAAALMAGTLVPAFGASGAGLSQSLAHYPPGIGIRLTDAPVALKDDPRAHVFIIDRMAPGAVIERHVAVSNGTSSTIGVSMYTGAAIISGGAFRPTLGRTQDDVASWTSTTPQTFQLPAQRAADVLVTIRVPSDAAPGERYAVIWAQTRTAAATPADLPQVSRAGIRIYLSIGLGNAPASNFDIVSMTASRDANGRPNVTALIRNTGGRALDLSGKLTLSNGPGGLSAGPFPVTLGTTLAPGQSEPLSVVLDKRVPDGPWLATLQVTSGVTTRSAHATLTFPVTSGQGAPVPAHMNRAGTSHVLRWAAAGFAAFALLVIIGYLLWRRGRRQNQDGDGVAERRESARV